VARGRHDLIGVKSWNDSDNDSAARVRWRDGLELRYVGQKTDRISLVATTVANYLMVEGSF